MELPARVPGSASKVQGLRFRVHGSGFRVQRSGFSVDVISGLKRNVKLTTQSKRLDKKALSITVPHFFC